MRFSEGSRYSYSLNAFGQKVCCRIHHFKVQQLGQLDRQIYITFFASMWSKSFRCSSFIFDVFSQRVRLVILRKFISRTKSMFYFLLKRKERRVTQSDRLFLSSKHKRQRLLKKMSFRQKICLNMICLSFSKNLTVLLSWFSTPIRMIVRASIQRVWEHIFWSPNTLKLEIQCLICHADWTECIVNNIMISLVLIHGYYFKQFLLPNAIIFQIFCWR